MGRLALPLIGLLFGLAISCGNDGSADDACDKTPGAEGCACPDGLCQPGLTCASGVCVNLGSTSAATTTTTDTDGTTDGVAPETEICDRADECNLLEPGVSSMDCADEMNMCTDGLITSAKMDWATLVDDCLALSNCKNFQTCISEVPDCPFPLDGGAGSTGGDICGPECAYCWYGMVCDATWNGDGECDCDCSNFVDVDCP